MGPSHCRNLSHCKKLGTPNRTIDASLSGPHMASHWAGCRFGDVTELRGGTPWRSKKTAIGGSMVTLNINGHDHSVDAPNDTPLLWVIREHLQMTGTKFGCGMAQCGACTVHLDGGAVRSCQTPVSAA